MEYYAYGHAICVLDLADCIDLKMLSFSCNDAEEYCHDQHRLALVRHIFVKGFYMIFEDVILNDVRFILRDGKRGKGNFHMKRITGDTFRKLYNKNIFPGMDPLKVFFTSYLPVFERELDTLTILELFMISTDFHKQISDRVMSGYRYIGGSKEKSVADYLGLLQDMFPKILRKDLRYIMNSIFIKILKLTYGRFTWTVNTPNWKVYLGKAKLDPIKFYEYYVEKWKKKMIYVGDNSKRYKFKDKGYIFFTENQYRQYLDDPKIGGLKTWIYLKEGLAHLCNPSEKGYLLTVKYKPPYYMRKYTIMDDVTEVLSVKKKIPLKLSFITSHPKMFKL